MSLTSTKNGFVRLLREECQRHTMIEFNHLTYSYPPARTGDATASVLRDVSLRIDEGDFVLADKSYDADAFREIVLCSGAEPVIPPRSNRKHQHHYDQHLYKERHLVECFINKIKHYRRVFSRFE